MASSSTQTSPSASTSEALSSKKRTCMCSPTTHPGSFRCSYHKQAAERQKQQTAAEASQKQQAAASWRKLNLLRSAMKNLVVRIGGAEGGEVVRRAFTTHIRPSSQHLRRRQAFQPRPTRLSLMSTAQDTYALE